jgi:hypothetical protein
MNIQTIQILFLLLDSIIKLAPWRIVTETMDRIGYGASESLARSLDVIAVSCAGFTALPATRVIGPVLLTGYLGGAMASHAGTGSPLFSHILPGFYLGVMVWGGLWLRSRDRKLSALPL